MSHTIRHRGPDGQGIKVCQHGQMSVGLAHQRLSIVDLSGGSQPMASTDESVWIVFNGEIYNHKKLRVQLESRGHRYTTRSDTESILHAYHEWGEECLSRLEGMFAFALWDTRKRSLFIARDRLGIKPLYYATFDGGLVFASEIKAILASDLVAPALATEMLPEQMTFGYLAGEQTLFRRVSKLLPGHYLSWKDGVLTAHQYWDVPRSPSLVDRNDAETIDQFGALFEDTVCSHLMSDVPLGVFLSGGLDSSAIAATMARHMPERLKTFSIGFEDGYYSELGYAKQVAEHLNSEHHEIVLTPNAFFASLPQLIWHQNEPLRAAPTVALYHVAKLASEHVKVVLTGEGGDELFAGYDRYWVTGFNLRWGGIYERLIPSWIRQHCVRDTLGKWPIPSALKRRLSHTFLARSQRPEDLLFDNWYAIFPQAVHARLFAEELYADLCKVDPYEASSAIYKGRSSGSALDDMLYLDQKSYLVALLTKQDTMSMAASIESRVPFLDHKVVEFAAQVPLKQKISGCSGKWLVKQALRKFLPKSIVDRKKTGFPVPLTDWLRRGFADPLWNIVSSERARSRGLFSPDYVNGLLQENQAGIRDHTEPLWSILNCELWARIFLDGESPEDITEEMMRPRPAASLVGV